MRGQRVLRYTDSPSKFAGSHAFRFVLYEKPKGIEARRLRESGQSGNGL